MGYRRGMGATGNETGDVRHVDHEVGAHLMGDVGEGLEVDDPRIGRGARDDEIGLDLPGNGTDLVHVDALGLGIQAIGMGIVETTRERELGTVREMAASRERHAQNDGTRIEQREVSGGVSADARMWLHVGVLCPEHLTGAVAGDRLDGVDVGAAAVIALAGITFGVLVGENRAHRLDDRQRGDVLGCDELERVALARQLVVDGSGNLRVCLGK